MLASYDRLKMGECQQGNVIYFYGSIECCKVKLASNESHDLQNNNSACFMDTS